MNRLAAMETFVRVVETGSFSAAARDLKLGQPAVSKTVAQLESRLGVQLLLRSTHRLAPTEAGQQFFERAKIVIESADEAERVARGAGTKLSGRLRIGAAVTFARLHVMPHLGAFLAQHPALEIEVLLEDRNIDLIGGGIDVALRMGTLADSALTARKLGRCARRVVGTHAYFVRAGEPTGPEDLQSHQAIIYEQRGGGTEWRFCQGDVEVPVTLKGRVRVNARRRARSRVRWPGNRHSVRMDVYPRTTQRQRALGTARLDAATHRPLGRVSHRPPRERQSASLRGLHRRTTLR